MNYENPRRAHKSETTEYPRSSWISHRLLGGAAEWGGLGGSWLLRTDHRPDCGSRHDGSGGCERLRSVSGCPTRSIDCSRTTADGNGILKSSAGPFDALASVGSRHCTGSRSCRRSHGFVGRAPPDSARGRQRRLPRNYRRAGSSAGLSSARRRLHGKRRSAGTPDRPVLAGASGMAREGCPPDAAATQAILRQVLADA